MNYSLLNFFVSILLAGSIFFSFSSKSLFFIWVCLEINMLMYVSMEKNYSSFMSVSVMKYYIIQGLSSMIFLFFILYSHTVGMVQDQFVSFFIFLSMWIKLGFYPFSGWYFVITENMSWVMWFLLNTFQKLIPLWVLSFNLFKMDMVMCLLIINMIYISIEMWNQVSLRWVVNCSSLNHFSWMVVSMNSHLSSWELYFFIYFLINFILMVFMKEYNWMSFLSMFLYKSCFSVMIFMLIFFNFVGIPPFLGFLGKLLVLKLSMSNYILLLLMFNTVIVCVVYLQVLMSSLNILMMFKFDIFNISLLLILLSLSIIMLFMIPFIL
uniref:NADH-ubiquinone oxidoreductase chain 2 n=1 Tax=Neoseiulus womersleyi TaxID=322050 RepID=A0A8F6U2S9_9ACAR|nr:NADH dehydrogenase subunit 2 [Neoseiulus womersleyi]